MTARMSVCYALHMYFDDGFHFGNYRREPVATWPIGYIRLAWRLLGRFRSPKSHDVKNDADIPTSVRSGYFSAQRQSVVSDMQMSKNTGILLRPQELSVDL